MSDSFEARRKAAEEQFFQKKNKEALLRLKDKLAEGKARPSPITGKPMEHVNIHGVVVDRCVDSGGIFLDSGELDELMKAAKDEHSTGWFSSFWGKIAG